MGYYLSSADGSYYEGDQANHLDTAVPQRPAASYDWNGSTWIVNAVRQAAENQAAQDVADSTAAKSYAKLTALRRMTPAQVQSWVAANVTNLAQAQDAITTLAIAVGILARRL